MSARIEAGRLGHHDLGKTITCPWRGGDLTATITSIHHTPGVVLLWLDHVGKPHLSLDPHTLVTITARGETVLDYDARITPGKEAAA